MPDLRRASNYDEFVWVRQSVGETVDTTMRFPARPSAMLNAGRGLTVETRVPRSVVNQLHFTGGNLDGVGPGWYADSSLLSLINQHMDGIRVWP